MHLIDQDLSGINQLGAIVGAISGYHGGKQPGSGLSGGGQADNHRGRKVL